jgi:predicted DNA-binding antitoxin AbrB/MazE fold protein
MTTRCTAIYERGVLRLTEPVSIPEGDRVEVIIVSGSGAAGPGGQARSPAEILAEIAALPTTGGDPATSRDHDRVQPIDSEESSALTPTLAERLKSVIGVVRGLPPDLAEQHDHYPHGRPKR